MNATITLPEDLVAWSTTVGHSRYCSSRCNGLQGWTKYLTPETRWMLDPQAAGAELAACEFFNIFWENGTLWYRYTLDYDLSILSVKIDVKRVTNPRDHLKIGTNRNPDITYLLVSGSLPVYTLLGWVPRGQEYMTERYKHGTYYEVPNTDLRNPYALIPELVLPKHTQAELHAYYLEQYTKRRDLTLRTAFDPIHCPRPCKTCFRPECVSDKVFSLC